MSGMAPTNYSPPPALVVDSLHPLGRSPYIVETCRKNGICVISQLFRFKQDHNVMKMSSLLFFLVRFALAAILDKRFDQFAHKCRTAVAEQR